MQMYMKFVSLTNMNPTRYTRGIETTTPLESGVTNKLQSESTQIRYYWIVLWYVCDVRYVSECY